MVESQRGLFEYQRNLLLGVRASRHEAKLPSFGSFYLKGVVQIQGGSLGHYSPALHNLIKESFLGVPSIPDIS